MGIEISETYTESLKEIANALDMSPRIGANEDSPEGVRYIQLSDTLAIDIAKRLREIIWLNNYASNYA